QGTYRSNQIRVGFARHSSLATALNQAGQEVNRIDKIYKMRATTRPTALAVYLVNPVSSSSFQCGKF
ncbi:MAG: hypothetical protein M3Q76_08285, partial [Acidobacteriota bacterium]|nr:hypothetical protein [Acidobacteriota bacterium]